MGTIIVRLPKTDFMMDLHRMELEVEKSIELGRLWRLELEKAVKKKIPIENFFQDSLKNSTLPSLLFDFIMSEANLKNYLTYIKSLESPPKWGEEYMKK